MADFFSASSRTARRRSGDVASMVVMLGGTAEDQYEDRADDGEEEEEERENAVRRMDVQRRLEECQLLTAKDIILAAPSEYDLVKLLRSVPFDAVQQIVLDSCEEVALAAGIRTGMASSQSQHDFLDRPLVASPRLRLGFEALDAQLGGGLKSGVLTEVVDATTGASGVTEFCLHVAVQAASPEFAGGEGIGVLWIDPTGTKFPADLFLARARKLTGSDFDRVLENVVVLAPNGSASAPDGSFMYLEDFTKRLVGDDAEEGLVEANVRLIVIDSVVALSSLPRRTTANVSAQRTDTSYSDRDTGFMKAMNDVLRTAEALDIAVLVTNASQRVTDDLGLTTAERWIPSMGLAWEHAVHTRLILHDSKRSYLNAPGGATHLLSIDFSACSPRRSIELRLVSDLLEVLG